MKSILFVLLMSLTTLYPTSTTDTSDTVPPPPPVEAIDLSSVEADDLDPANPLRINIRAGINFGRRRNNCKGLGICSAHAGASVSSGNTSFDAFATVTGTRGGLATSIIFEAKTMNAKIRSTHFASTNFIFKDEVSIKLRGEQGDLTFKVAAGPYRIYKTQWGDYELKLGDKGGK